MVSALKGTGLEEMLGRVAELLERPMVTLTLEIPYDRGDLVAAAHRIGDVVEEKHDDQGTILEVRIPESAREQFTAFSR
jgi:GTP-binding protein HflX